MEKLVIDASVNVSPFNWREFWDFRELTAYLAWRDIKARYKQTLLGVGWAILQPIVSTGVYTIFFGGLAQIPSDGVPYALFTFTSLLIWNFFTSTVNRATSSIVNNGHLISKVYFPRILIPLSAVVVSLIDYLLAMTLLLVLFPFFKLLPSSNILLVPILTLLVGLFALGLSFFLAPLNVRFRDVSHTLPFATQMWMFSTPVIYPLSHIPEKWRWLSMVNPMTGYVEAYRSLFFGLPLEMHALQVSIGATLIVFLTGLLVFRKFESGFADII